VLGVAGVEHGLAGAAGIPGAVEIRHG
jgi:hypothetical protein